MILLILVVLYVDYLSKCFLILLVFHQGDKDHRGISNVAPADAPLHLLPIRGADSWPELLLLGMP